MKNIKGKIAVITGAASGMGAATARLLAEQGVQVMLLDRNETSVRKVAENLNAEAFVCDVTNAEQSVEVIEHIKNRFGAASICVNCAGIAPGARVVGRDGAMALEDFSAVVQINLIGTFNMMRLAAAMMSQSETLDEEERGVIINTASIAAYEGQIGQVAYSASKAGVIGMTLPAAREFARFGVRVVTIAPGLIETPMLSNMPSKVQEALHASTVFPKRLGQAQEFADLVLHIIENPMLNGSVIRLDGAVRLQP